MHDFGSPSNFYFNPLDTITVYFSQIFYEMKDTVLNIQHRRNSWLHDWVVNLINYRSDINVYVTVKDLLKLNADLH